MKHYFMQLELNQPKNKAQKALQEFAQQYADCLIDEESYKKFKTKLDTRIAEVNIEFFKCTDIPPLREDNQWRYPKELQINVDAGITFLIRSVKRVEESTELCSCEMPAKIKGENKCWRCKKVLLI